MISVDYIAKKERCINKNIVQKQKEEGFKFFGYIAYRHDNFDEADKLHKFLETYKLGFKFDRKTKAFFFDDKNNLHKLQFIIYTNI